MASLPNRVFRFVNNFDFVPRVPISVPVPIRRVFSSFLFSGRDTSNADSNFHAVGRLILIDSRGIIREHSGSLMEAQLALSQTIGLLSLQTIRQMRTESPMRIALRVVLPFFVNDHFISDYVRHLATRVTNHT
eukprot:c23474_g1_i1.p1 GENE.c23474_g1_i1~~c23474_g1_i1.p1  ORF type:complete len:133 (+),score=19.29 c23474_g1_i1:195-593(+)